MPTQRCLHTDIQLIVYSCVVFFLPLHPIWAHLVRHKTQRWQVDINIPNSCFWHVTVCRQTLLNRSRSAAVGHERSSEGADNQRWQHRAIKTENVMIISGYMQFRGALPLTLDVLIKTLLRCHLSGIKGHRIQWQLDSFNMSLACTNTAAAMFQPLHLPCVNAGWFSIHRHESRTDCNYFKQLFTHVKVPFFQHVTSVSLLLHTCSRRQWNVKKK